MTPTTPSPLRAEGKQRRPRTVDRIPIKAGGIPAEW
jgi:hypothetical protein